MPNTLLSLFSEVRDPRRGQGQMYPQAPILLFTVLAMLAGAASYRQVHAFIAVHLDRLNAAFGVSVRKPPAYTTVRFILRGLDGEELERVFRRHAAGLPTPPAQEPDDVMPDDAMPACVAIDGKTLRGSFDAFNDRKAAHLLSAFASDGQIILGHLAIDEKSNEIPAAQDLIATLGLTGRMFTLDAMHAQKNLRRSPGHGEPSAGSTQGEPAQSG
jgi:DDE_Tnp_1-associated